MSSSSAYTFFSLLLALLLVIVGGATVVLLDPEARLNTDQLMYAPDYISKPIMMSTVNRNALILGSSRMMEIDPESIIGFTAYNGGMGGTTPENMLELLDLYAAPGDVVILGVDLYMMNEFHTPLQPERWRDEASSQQGALSRFFSVIAPNATAAGRILDESAYVLNIGTFARALAGQSAGRRAADGGRIPVTYEDGQIFNANKLIVHRVCKTPLAPPRCDEGYMRLLLQSWNGHFGRFSYSMARVETFRQIRELLNARGIRYVVVINPEHAAFWPIVRGPRLDAISNRFKADVMSSFDNVCDYFTEEYAEPTLYYATDPFHYLPDTGARLVNECLARFDIAP